MKLKKQYLHKIIKESINQILNDNITFMENTDDYGGKSIVAYNDNQELGYININIYKYLEDLESEISETDCYETAREVCRKLNYNKPTIELADIDVRKEFRNMGISKMLLEYTLKKYSNCQFYLRVCPEDGVDEQTLANSVMKYGFTYVNNTENGTFLIKK